MKIIRKKKTIQNIFKKIIDTLTNDKTKAAYDYMCLNDVISCPKADLEIQREYIMSEIVDMGGYNFEKVDGLNILFRLKDVDGVYFNISFVENEDKNLNNSGENDFLIEVFYNQKKN